MSACSLDHIVVVAPTLAVGVAYVRDMLGADPQTGGEHARMGTHNCVLKLGDRLYLEVIAINPNAPHPGRPRWFGLDQLDAAAPVRLAAWVARTHAIGAAVRASPVSLGDIERMSRGALEWQITIPRGGGMPLDGIAPVLIEWPPGVHPATSMPESGCALVRLEGFHPSADAVSAVLEAIGFEGNVVVSAPTRGMRPYLVAHIRTPAGVRPLGAP